MSNQVYENSQNKYYLQNGLNLYEVVQQTVNNNAQVTLAWVDQIVQNPGIVVLSSTNQRFEAVKRGVYHFTFNFTMKSATNPQTVDIEPEIIVSYHGAVGGIEIATLKERIVAPGVGTGDEVRTLNLGASVFMNETDYVEVKFDSRGGFGILVQYSSCNIVAI